MDTVLLIVHLVVCVGIIVLVLLQQGKGADMGSGFGAGGNSGSLFGATGSANFLSRTTGIFATLFFVSSAVLAYVSSDKHKSVMAKVTPKAPVTSPANAIPNSANPMNLIPQKAKEIPN